MRASGILGGIMGWASHIDKRSRVLAMVALTIAGGACKKDPPADADESYACTKGDKKACDRLNAKRFAECDATRDAAACAQAAEAIYGFRTSGPGGDADAFPHFVKACEMGSGESCERAGRIAEDRATKQKYFERACELGIVLACETRGDCFLGSNEQDREAGICPKDYPKAKTYFLRACELKRKTTIGCERAENVDRLSGAK